MQQHDISLAAEVMWLCEPRAVVWTQFKSDLQVPEIGL